MEGGACYETQHPMMTIAHPHMDEEGRRNDDNFAIATYGGFS